MIIVGPMKISIGQVKNVSFLHSFDTHTISRSSCLMITENAFPPPGGSATQWRLYSIVSSAACIVGKVGELKKSAFTRSPTTQAPQLQTSSAAYANVREKMGRGVMLHALGGKRHCCWMESGTVKKETLSKIQ